MWCFQKTSSAWKYLAQVLKCHKIARGQILQLQILIYHFAFDINFLWIVGTPLTLHCCRTRTTMQIINPQSNEQKRVQLVLALSFRTIFTSLTWLPNTKANRSWRSWILPPRNHIRSGSHNSHPDHLNQIIHSNLSTLEDRCPGGPPKDLLCIPGTGPQEHDLGHLQLSVTWALTLSPLLFLFDVGESNKPTSTHALGV